MATIEVITKFSLVFGIVVMTTICQSSYSCSPSEQCTIVSQSITCDTGECNIECNGYQQCRYFDIHCSTGTTCNIICTGHESCRDVDIFATNAHALSVTVPSSTASDYALEWSTILCPNNGPGGNIACSITSNDNNGDYQFADMVIKAVEGFNDVTLYCSSSNCNVASTKLQCTVDYSYSCTVVGNTQNLDQCATLQPTYCETYLLPTSQPTNTPTTSQPTTNIPTTSFPTTIAPTTNIPTTSIPTTNIPTTSIPTTNIPTTFQPTTSIPTTNVPTTSFPTTFMPSTNEPTSLQPTTAQPTTAQPTTYSPTTFIPTTSIPTTNIPTTNFPTTIIPTNFPTSTAPTTSTPTTSTPTILAPDGAVHISTSVKISTMLSIVDNNNLKSKDYNWSWIVIGSCLILVILCIICFIIVCVYRCSKHKSVEVELEKMSTNTNQMMLDITHTNGAVELQKVYVDADTDINVNSNDNETFPNDSHDNNNMDSGEFIVQDDEEIESKKITAGKMDMMDNINVVDISRLTSQFSEGQIQAINNNKTMVDDDIEMIHDVNDIWNNQTVTKGGTIK